MKDFINAIAMLWRRQRYVSLTGSGIICKTPGYLVYAHMIGTFAETSTVAVHDGENSNEEKIVDLRAYYSGADHFVPSLPVPFQRGLYAGFGATATSFTAVIITRRE